MSDNGVKFEHELRDIADAIGHRGLVLAMVRAATAKLKRTLEVDEQMSLDAIRERRLARAIEDHLCGDLRAALTARDNATSEAELASAQEQIADAWRDVVHAVDETWGVVCPPEEKSHERSIYS